MECLFARSGRLVYNQPMLFCISKLYRPIILCLFLLAGSDVYGEESTDPFQGVEMEQVIGRFIVTKSAVNLRASPSTNGTKIGKLLKDEQVKVVGKAKGSSWYAVERDNGERGFSYGPVFLRVIDGSLRAPIRGRASIEGGPDCQYNLKYEKNEAEGEEKEELLVADYWVDMTCLVEGKKMPLTGFMFLTEMPWNLQPGGSHQISLELANIAIDYDRVISAVTMWRIDKRNVVFDSVAPKKFQASQPIGERKAEDVPSALRSAIEIALSSWSKELWKTIATKGAAAVTQPLEDGDEKVEEKETENNSKGNSEDEPKKPLPGMEHSGRGDD